MRQKCISKELTPLCQCPAISGCIQIRVPASSSPLPLAGVRLQGTHDSLMGKYAPADRGSPAATPIPWPTPEAQPGHMPYAVSAATPSPVGSDRSRQICLRSVPGLDGHLGASGGRGEVANVAAIERFPGAFGVVV
jgi:hypothetical protein